MMTNPNYKYFPERIAENKYRLLNEDFVRSFRTAMSDTAETMPKNQSFFLELPCDCYRPGMRQWLSTPDGEERFEKWVKNKPLETASCLREVWNGLKAELRGNRYLWWQIT